MSWVMKWQCLFTWSLHGPRFFEICWKQELNYFSTNTSVQHIGPVVEWISKIKQVCKSLESKVNNYWIEWTRLDNLFVTSQFSRRNMFGYNHVAQHFKSCVITMILSTVVRLWQSLNCEICLFIATAIISGIITYRWAFTPT